MRIDGETEWYLVAGEKTVKFCKTVGFSKKISIKLCEFNI